LPHNYVITATEEEMNVSARRTDPETSHIEVRRIANSDVDARILAYLSGTGIGGTSLEISEATGITRVSVSPRLKPLELMGKVIRTTEKRSGGIVWKVPA
jgi:predicted esterase YcpF (UPF0227 family)